MNKLNIPNLPSVWAILPEDMLRLEHEYVAYIGGNREYRAYIETNAKGLLELDVNTAKPTYFIDDDIAVMQIEGIILPKGDVFSQLFGGVAALDVLTRDFKALVDDPDIKAIVLQIDSPGGSTSGMFAFANMVYEARSVKPVYAYSSSVMTSAAALFGAAARESAVADESTITGSLAVRQTHIDISGLLEKLGVKKTEVSSGQFKNIASSIKPLSEKGLEVLQAQVDYLDRVMVEQVAMFRGVSADIVRSQMAQGKIFIGSQGIKAGLIDGINMPPEQFMKAVKDELMAANFSIN